jgi:hypothetical protein
VTLPLIFLAVLSALAAVMRVMSLLRGWPGFGPLVRLIRVSILKISNFVLFMAIWVTYFALAYYILGSEIDGGDDFSLLAPPESRDSVADEVGDVGNDYSELAAFWTYPILAWRNSIGDLSVPAYEGWTAVLAEQDNTSVAALSPYENVSVRSIEWLIWAHWLGTQLLMLIILFNVLVALVGQAFDEEMNLGAITASEARAQLNREYMELRQALAKCIKRYLPNWGYSIPAVDFLVCTLSRKDP